MGDSGSDPQGSGWGVTPGTSSSSVHILYQQADEDEPSSSIPTSSSSDYNQGSSSASFVPSSYRSQPVFQSNERYGAEAYSVQGVSVSSHIYQAAESSFQGQQEVQPDQYGDIVAVGNEAQMQIYSNINDNENSFTGSQPVASSSVADGGYSVPQMLVDGIIVTTGDNPVPVTLQRVISPDVDSTVSQSISIPATHRHITENDNPALRPSGSNSAMIQMHISQPQSEVSTSDVSGSQVNIGHRHSDNDIGHGDMDTVRHREVESVRHDNVEAGPSGIIIRGRGTVGVIDSVMSSITGSVSNEAEAEVSLTNTHKTDRRSLDDIVSGEPDTTQEDDGDYDDDEDMEDSSSMNREEELNSHMMPTIDNQSQPSSSNNVVDSTQIMTAALPNSNSVMSANQITASNLSANQMAASNLSANYIQVNMSDYQDQMQVTPHSLSSNEIQLGQITANQLTASMESQLSQATYILDSSSVDTSSKVQPSDLGLQLANFMSARGLKIQHDLEQPGTSTDDQSFNRRKSTRLAHIDSEEATWRKREYVSQPYNPNQLWCEDCMQSYDTECEIHKLNQLPDKLVLSRAWASLPPSLQIFRIDESELGVFTKRAIPKRTQFGPFIAELVPDDESVTRHSFPLMVEQQGPTLFYDTSDENKCNWMMFVRPASTYAEQNCVAYQHENEIYFTVTKDISEMKTELKVWYAAHYAERWGKPCLKATEADLQAIEEQMCKFQCYECPKRFRTAAALQKHLITHDSDPLKSGGASEEPSSSQSMPAPRPRSRKALAPQHSLRRKYLANKKESGGMESSGSPGIYHWKKRSTNIYLNKTLKKYHKRHETEMLRKSARTNQQMMMKNDVSSETEAGELFPDGNEFECESCDLVFNNTTLLNLHALVHTEESREEAKLAFQLESLLGTNSMVDQLQINCPACPQQFFNKKDLVIHVGEHGKSALKLNTDYHSDIMGTATNRQHRCGVCFKTFTSIDRLAKHHQCHGNESEKPFQCNVCFKRFINNSAMSCHMKTHSSAKYYQCPICHVGFDQTSAMREHSLLHANPNGSFNCPHCDKVFVEFLVLKKHVRGFHTNRTYPCEQCDKVFPRADKLRLHMLRHSSIREFMCDTCGRQFKRKDKLKEHIKRMHSTDREEKDRMKALRPHAKRFIPKVSPTEYHRFIYKCHLCLLGFKRRGMLVNHIAKRHPDLKPESVPELNLPILKTQRDYYCQYCDKVYKSSSKRKSHILKNHPGSELPQSARKKSCIDEVPGVPNPTYSQTVGSITTMPHQCEHCHKQYASKAKLLQHQRKHHPELMPHLERFKHQAAENATTYIVETTGEPTDSQAADLLTQAMSELNQSVEFRQIAGQPGEPTYLTRIAAHGTPTMVQIQTSGGHGTQTIELAQLSQALQHFAPPQGHLPIQVQVSSGVTGQIQLPITSSQAGTSANGTHILTVDQMSGSDPAQQQATSTTQTQQLNFLPISLASGTYIPKSWNNYTQYKTH